jgi:hypothetical protein
MCSALMLIVSIILEAAVAVMATITALLAVWGFNWACGKEPSA